MKKTFSGHLLENISFPLGGIGAGMLCIEGTGAFGSVSLRHRPDLYNEPYMYAALAVDGCVSRVLEGQIVRHKIWGGQIHGFMGAGNGMTGRNYGLPRFRECRFGSRFPFAYVSLRDKTNPVTCGIRAFSPFVPGNEDDSSLPFAAAEYTFENTSQDKKQCVFYFSALQFMGVEGGEDRLFVEPLENGFLFRQEKTEKQGSEGAFCVVCDTPARVDSVLYDNDSWLAGLDTMTMLWNNIAKGEAAVRKNENGRSPGASLAAPFVLEPGEKKSIAVRFAWYVPESDQQIEGGGAFYEPWYAGRYGDIYEAEKDFALRYAYFEEEAERFAREFEKQTLPEAALEAAEANLSILKTPTLLRQKDGRLWGWEGLCDTFGSCHGSCSHVYNYAQALCSLFPRLEQSLRDTEFEEDQDENGHQQFRTLLPIRPNSHNFHAASDGQPGGIMKLYREWRGGAGDDWLRAIWPKAKKSMDYCINLWDPKKEGVLTEPHHNTYDIEFWGPDSMCTSFYLGALKAFSLMGKALGEDTAFYEELYKKGKRYVETELWNGEYFYQKTRWTGLKAKIDAAGDPLLERMGPKYQYGEGCLSDGVCGAWLAKCCGLGDILDKEKTLGHLLSVYKYNLKEDLFDHANVQRPGYALGEDGGLLVCSWPRGGKPEIPFPYSDEVFTGIEYQVASHLASLGRKKEALRITEIARKRFDGERRNPYDEYECGHFYARAMASWQLLSAFSGVSYDAASQTLYYGKDDCRVLIACRTGYGTVTIENGRCRVEAAKGSIPVKEYLQV